MKRIGLGIFLLTILATAVPIAAAKPYFAVNLIYFLGSEEQDGVHLIWETATEIETIAFYIRRSSGTDFIDLTELYDRNGNPYIDGLIYSEGDPITGSDYVAIDRSIVTGTTYTYQLMEIEADNSVSLLETIIVATGATATPTLTPSPTPIVISGNPTATFSSGQNSATNTPMPTMTRTQSTNNSVASTNTPFPIITPTSQTQPNATAVSNDNSLASTSLNQSPLNSNTQTGAAEAANGAAQAQSTTDAGYPGEPIPTLAVENESYPGQEPILPPAGTATPYPVEQLQQNEEPTPTIIAVIGNSDNDSGEEPAEEPAQVSSASSISVLWGGFFLALIIFIAAIVGSIMIFVRKRD